jgi:hypothetical protein
MVKDHAIDLLNEFSLACRVEQDFLAKGRVSRPASSDSW